MEIQRDHIVTDNWNCQERSLFFFQKSFQSKEMWVNRELINIIANNIQDKEYTKQHFLQHAHVRRRIHNHTGFFWLYQHFLF